MAFFQQLRLLLWKNGLAVIRQPVWSLTLIIWPLIIFIILAVTRNQFPPIVRETCYVGPRNLPSTGLFPFLQTLMCNTDSHCHNKSRLVDPATSKTRNARSLTSSVEKLGQVGDLFKSGFSESFSSDYAELSKVLDILGSSQQNSPRNAALMSAINSTVLEGQESLDNMLESVNLLKRAICTVILPMINTTSPDAFSYAVITFCHTNNTMFEVSLHTLNQILTELMLTRPNEIVKVAEMTVTLFHQLQNETSLWESLLAIPQLFSGGCDDQVMSRIEVLLKNIQGAVHLIQNNFPETHAPLSKVHPPLAGGISMINYVKNWPGKNVTIPLGELVMMSNDSISDMLKYVLENVLDYRIPLDQAVFLMLDKDIVHSYLCDNSSNIFWSATACSTGIVDKVLAEISPQKVAKQVLLAWSQDVAKHDVRFVKGLLHSLIGGFSSGEHEGSNITRTRRSTETQPQNVEEELFLRVGEAVMEIVQTVPEVDMVVHTILKTGFQSMKLGTVAMETVEEILTSILKDASQLQMTYHMLLTNQSESSAWMGRVLDSIMEVIMKAMSPDMSPEHKTCEELLISLEWLLSSNSIKNEVWKSMICPNNSTLQEALLMDWEPLIRKAQDVYYTLTGRADFNITLSMILSEWHELYENSMEFTELFSRLSTELGGEYWMNWMPENITHSNVTGILQQSVFWSMVNLGDRIEKSHLWPHVKDYFHMANWILFYGPGVATQPTNCSLDNNLAPHCDTGLNWEQFVWAVAQGLMSPSDFLVNSLKGSVNVLQYMYSDIYKHMAASYLNQEIKGGDALSAYLINLMHNLHDFLNMISSLSDQDLNNPHVMLPYISNLLESTGLSPLLPLLNSTSPLNVSMILDVASKLGRLNQHIFNFNETDPTMPELEELIMQFLSLEGDLTLSLSHIMGHTLLTYSDYFHPDEVAHLRKAIQPFTNQTSAGFVEAILSAIELLKTVIDSPNGDPTDIILGYIRQIQEIIVSLYRLQKSEQLMSPNGQNITAQVADLHLLSMDFLNLLTPESLQNLSHAGPDAAQDIVAQKFVAFLPNEVQRDAALFLKNFKALQSHITKCVAGQDCLAEISEIFTFLDQILDMMLSANGTVTIKIAATSSGLSGLDREEIASTFFSLLLSPNDAAHIETFKQTLHFIKLILNTPNITVSDAQNALMQSNLTIEELNAIAALAGAADINKLMMNMMEIASAKQCFEPHNDMVVTTECVMGLINGFSSFLTQLSSLRNDTTIFSIIPAIINKTISDFIHVNFSSNPNMALVQSLNRTLANIKMNLQLNQMNTPEIMNEIRVVENLIQLLANMQPLNNTQIMDPLHAQKVYLELVKWYLNKLENISSNSSVSELLHPLFSITQMQVALQLAQTDFYLFVSNKVQFLMNNLQGPIDGTDLSKIGNTAVEILRHLLDLIKVNHKSQNEIEGFEPLFNTTMLHSTKLQIEQYLSLIEEWLKQPNVPLLFSSMLKWENTTMTTPATDFHHFLQTMAAFLSDDQLAYLSIISNITESLNKALMVAEQHDLKNESFVAAIVEAVQSAMQILTITDIYLPLPVQQDILEIVEESVNLIVQPDMSVVSGRNSIIIILKKAEGVIQETVPDLFSEYVLGGIRLVTTYFETISEAAGTDNLNQIILNEMKMVQSLLLQNSTAQPYVSALINITHFILESGQGNMSLWASFENASAGSLPQIIHQMGKLLSMFWPLFVEGTGSHVAAPSLEAFTHLVPVLENVLTGNADQDTWDKLEQMLEALLSTLEGTDLRNNLTSVLPLFEKIMGSMMMNMQAENVMILSLQMPILNLMTETVQSLNATHFNLSEVLERMQLAIESTVLAAQQVRQR